MAHGKRLGSFISEKTAEYILVPNLVRHLGSEFRDILPMYFWSTREGSAIAMSQMAETTVRVIAAFARRPKVSKSGTIMMKVNAELVEFTTHCAEFTIPVLAGVPLVASLSELRCNSEAVWFHIQASAPIEDSYLELRSRGKLAASDPTVTRGPLNRSDLCQLARSSPLVSWPKASQQLRELRCRAESNRFPYFGGYKPFYMILK